VIINKSCRTWLRALVPICFMARWPFKSIDFNLLPVVAILTVMVRPFSDRQIAFVQVSAAQAPIAIKHTRLFNETKEALVRQTATSENPARDQSIAHRRVARILSSTTNMIGPALLCPTDCPVAPSAS
jgi:predicted nucleic acid-binding protein